MLSKSGYRTRFKLYQTVIKISNIANECNIPQSSLSKFIKSDKFDSLISINKLELLENTIHGALVTALALYGERYKGGDL